MSSNYLFKKWSSLMNGRIDKFIKKRNSIKECQYHVFCEWTLFYMKEWLWIYLSNFSVILSRINERKWVVLCIVGFYHLIRALPYYIYIYIYIYIYVQIEFRYPLFENTRHPILKRVVEQNFVTTFQLLEYINK